MILLFGFYRRHLTARYSTRHFCNSVTEKLNQLRGNSSIHPFWLDQLDVVDRPAARALIPQLTSDNCLGYLPASGPPKKGTLLQYVITQKEMHPTKIILTRVGEFYETYGVDAVMLVQYAGLNAMGGKPRAGFPIRNIQGSLNNLTAAGLTIAVYEEVGEAEAKSKIKSRALAQIVSPANSTYIYNAALQAADIEYYANSPVVAIASTSQGYTYYEYRVDERVVSVSDRLTLESLLSLISYSQPLEPIYSNCALSLTSRTEVITGYSLEAFPQHVWSRICSEFGIGISSPNDSLSELPLIRAIRHDISAPRPLYTSTALQIGLLPNPHVPDLLQYLLPKPHAKSTERFLRRWLMHPPPFAIASHMRHLCSLFSTSSLSVPIFIPLPLGKIVNLLTSRQCNVSAFSDIRYNMSLVLSTLQSPAWNESLEYLLPLVSYESGVLATQSTLINEADMILRCIDHFIHPHVHTSDQPTGQVPSEFFDNNDIHIYDRLHTNASEEIAALSSNLDKRRQELIAVVDTDFGSDALYDTINNILYVKKTGRPGIEYIPARDRYHQVVAKRFSTLRVVQATDNYLTAITEMSSHIKVMLQELCDQLCKHVIAITHAAYFALLLDVIYSHTIMAQQQKWTLPTSSAKCLTLRGLTPYWLNSELATANDISINGLIFLTAPNMSGKSTLMRSVLIAALLANCGLFVPCADAAVPYYDGYYLRTTCYDVPAEGKSAFGIEMQDVQVMLRDCTNESLVMLDEIGKGTSSRDGSCFAGALLEHFDALGCHGIFATHLHEVMELTLHVNSLRNMRMGVSVDENGAPLWTYKVEPGICTDSLAYVTAARFNIPHEIIKRARELSEQYDSWCKTTHAFLPSALPDTSVTLNSLQSFISSNLPQLANITPVVIPHNYNPPAAIALASCIYLLLIQPEIASRRYLYVGESVSVVKRLSRHRRNIKHSTITTLVYPVKNKSQARSIETQLIRILKHRGFDVRNKADEMHVAFGELEEGAL